ncbi:hypothetical protein MalM25_27400 [Planctomycetes bacterium MalM25]|nr:hypothetical protein MalM25_27400 [Planctomycetes bacterium MalM25]
MKIAKPLIAVVAVLTLAPISLGAEVIIPFLDIRSTGVFNHNAQVSNVMYDINDGNGFQPSPINNPSVGDPILVQMTYGLLDLDGDFTNNDEITFTMQWTKIGEDGGALRFFGQGADTGFGNLNDVEVSLVEVTGTTTDNGDEVVFDGFTGAAAGFGGNVGGIDRNVEINGVQVGVDAADTGGFQFSVESVDFDAPAPTVTFDNSGFNRVLNGDYNSDGIVDAADYTVWRDGGSPDSSQAGYDLWDLNYREVGGTGSVVARNYDLQFSTVAPPPAFAVPEPASAMMLLLGSLAAVGRKARR